MEGPPSKNLNICFEEWTWTVPDLPLLTIHPGFSSTAAFCIIIPVLFQHFKVLGYKRFKECKWLSADKNTQLEKYWKYKTVQCTTASFFYLCIFFFSLLLAPTGALKVTLCRKVFSRKVPLFVPGWVGGVLLFRFVQFCSHCSADLMGRNTMAENLAAIVFSRTIIRLVHILTYHND